MEREEPETWENTVEAGKLRTMERTRTQRGRSRVDGGKTRRLGKSFKAIVFRRVGGRRSEVSEGDSQAQVRGGKGCMDMKKPDEPPGSSGSGWTGCAGAQGCTGAVRASSASTSSRRYSPALREPANWAIWLRKVAN